MRGKFLPEALFRCNLLQDIAPFISKSQCTRYYSNKFIMSSYTFSYYQTAVILLLLQIIYPPVNRDLGPNRIRENSSIGLAHNWATTTWKIGIKFQKKISERTEEEDYWLIMESPYLSH